MSESKVVALEINGYEYVDLGLPSGLKWATCNVGANSPEEYGDYYAWGELEVKSAYTDVNSLTYHKDYSDISGNPAYDVARAKWGSSWRMPTEAEFKELIDNCKWEWTIREGKKGYNVIGSKGNSIFLPAAGYRDGTYVDRGAGNGYCSNAVDSDFNDNACGMRFEEGNYDWSSFGRSNGRPVRPVCK